MLADLYLLGTAKFKRRFTCVSAARLILLIL